MKPILQLLVSGVGVIVLFVVMILAIIGLASVCFTGPASYRPPAAATQPAATATRIVISQGAGQDFPEGTATRPAQTATPAPTDTPPPGNTPAPAPTLAPAPTQAPTQPAPAPTQSPPPAAPAPSSPPQAANANFSGVWRIVDTVTQGSNVGQTYTFDVSLNQNGNVIAGGNSGILISGRVEGTTAYLEYSQPALGYSGTFTWTMAGGGGSAQGTFTNSYPNAGTSSLVRLG